MSKNPPKHWTTTLCDTLDTVVIDLDMIEDIRDVDWDEEPTEPIIMLVPFYR